MCLHILSLPFPKKMLIMKNSLVIGFDFVEK